MNDETNRLQDGYVLHFLKELPAWVILGMFTGAFLAVWQVSHDDFIPRIIDGLVGALLTSIVAQRPKAPVVPPTNITADSVNPSSMDNAVVNAESLNVENQNKENPE
jgi:uncharacterized membrane protein YeaQ/YmgE (transglycosylase-associated protein family)